LRCRKRAARPREISFSNWNSEPTTQFHSAGALREICLRSAARLCRCSAQFALRSPGSGIRCKGRVEESERVGIECTRKAAHSC
jgi:hypothetical protein